MQKATMILWFAAVIGPALASSPGVVNAQIHGAVQYPPASVGDDAQPPPPAGLVPQRLAPRRIELGISGSSQVLGSYDYHLRLRSGIGGFAAPTDAPTAAGN